MSQNCGAIEYLPGGTITQSTIVNSQITNSDVSTSNLRSCSIESLISVDDMSAQTIVNALAKLTPAQLQPLMDKLMEAMSFADAATEPDTSDDAATPTTMYGTRNALLGTPKSWKTLPDGSRIPCY